MTVTPRPSRWGFKTCSTPGILGHYITNALKVKELFVKDVNYIVRDGEAVIVDEFVRVMPGRRWSDSQHQAIEAKEALPIGPRPDPGLDAYQNFFLPIPAWPA